MGHMPRDAYIRVRVHPDALQALDQRAQLEARSRADTTRLLLKYAITHMPKGWTGQ